MSKNNIITVVCFDTEIGRLGFDENKNTSYFQYNAEFLKSNQYINLFPNTAILKRIPQTQVFSTYNNETFRGLPPMISDSLPDMFGNIIFKKWLETSHKTFKQISVLEQLTYVANRGMGALEYKPGKNIPASTSIDVTEIAEVLKQVLANKTETKAQRLNSEALLNIFKMGTSAGGARPKILISENKKTGEIIPGDLNTSASFNHYLVKLAVDENLGYSKEAIEYTYYQTALDLGIDMMPCKLIDQKHFATLRFDRQDGKKIHALTVTGITGWDFNRPENSSYENVFDLALFLKVPHAQIEQLFKRMVFNVIFCNTDDHLKNHSFMYNAEEDRWNLSPAYDLTYSLNPLINYTRSSRALSINQKRMDITLDDILEIANTYTIKNPKGAVKQTQEATELWKQKAEDLNIPQKIIESIYSSFVKLM